MYDYSPTTKKKKKQTKPISNFINKKISLNSYVIVNIRVK